MPPSMSLPNRPCAVCGTDFAPQHRRQRYCQKRCLWKSKNDSTHARRGDELNARKREKYASDPEFRERLTRTRNASRAADPERPRTYARANFQKTRLTHPWLSLTYGARGRAKEKGFAFDLTAEWGEARWTGNCEVTGMPFSLGLRGHGPTPYAPSIDRIEPDKGYVQDNCRFVLMAVNALKGNGTNDMMYEVAEAITRSRLQSRSG